MSAGEQRACALTSRCLNVQFFRVLVGAPPAKFPIRLRLSFEK